MMSVFSLPEDLVDSAQEGSSLERDHRRGISESIVRANEIAESRSCIRGETLARMPAILQPTTRLSNYMYLST